MSFKLMLAGMRVAAAALRRKQIPADDVSSVALIELSGLGDAIAMLPALQGFRALFPSAQLHLIVESSVADLLAALDLPVTVHGVARVRSAAGVASAISLVRDLNPSVACSMSPPRRNALVALLSGAPGIAGYLRYTDSLTPFLLSTPVEAIGMQDSGGMRYERHHISERALLVCRALGFRSTFAPKGIKIAAAMADRIRFDLTVAGVITPREYVVIHPCAGWSYRQWPQQSFASLARRFLDTKGTTVVFLWDGKNEGELPELRQQFIGEPRVMFAPSLDLPGCAVLISGSSLFVGNDSGPLHLAAALGVPVVGLFGPSDPALTAPHTLVPSSLIYKKVDCSPCDQRRCVRPGDPCMNMITVDDAFTAALSVQRRAIHA